MAMRDERGRFIKRVKDRLAGVQPATLEHMLSSKEEGIKESMEMSTVSIDSANNSAGSANEGPVGLNVVPTKQQHARQSARRSYIMSATITVVGNLTADPELRTTNNGKSVINFSLAYTPRRPDGTDGETSFYNIAAWEYLADNFAASFKKGDRLIVVGRVSQDKWQDKASEKVMSRLSITAEEIGGTIRFHTCDMQKVSRKAAPTQEEVPAADSESEDVFA